MADEQRLEGTIELGADTTRLNQAVEESAKVIKKAEGEIKKSTDNVTANITSNNEKVVASEKKKAEAVKAAAKASRDLEKLRGANIDRRAGIQKVKTEGQIELENKRRVRQVEVELTKRGNKIVEAEQRRITEVARVEGKKQLSIWYEVNRERRRDAEETTRIINRSLQGPAGTADKVRALITGQSALGARATLMGGGMTRTEAFLSQLSAGFGPQESSFLAGSTKRLPLSMGGRDRDAERAAREAESEAKRQERQFTLARERTLKAQASITRGRLREETKLKNQADKLEAREQANSIRAAKSEANKRDIEIRREAKQLERIINRSLLAPIEVQAQVANAIKGLGPAMQRRTALAGGANMTQAFQQNLMAGGFNAQNANFLVGAGGRRPVIFGGTPPRVPGGGAGGGSGFFGGIGRRLAGLGGGGIAGSIAGGLLGGFGVGMGGYALANAGRAVVEATQQATAYDRQRVAAENLAGSQEKLNNLLSAYARASGGAVDKSTELNNVTRLLATGYAETVPQVERFVRATRGASIALGKPQDYVIQETQLAISNTSQKRLDQIGLSIAEVTDRIGKLRKENASWSRETAFQEAVLSIMEEKYSALTRTVEGQATEVEKLGKEWRDLRLTMGQASQAPINEMSSWLSGLLRVLDVLMKVNQEANKQKRWSGGQMMGPLFSPWAMGDQPGAIGVNTGRFVESSVSRDRGRHPARTTSLFKPRFNDDQLSVIEEGYEAEKEIATSAAKARNDELAQYEEQRTQTAANFAKQMVREEEDFARQRARGLRDYERSIVDIMRDSQEREAEMQEDLDERLADYREDSAKRLADIDEGYQKQREDAEKKHRENMLKAAGQLDAIAVLEERKRFREEQKEREEQHDEAVEDERESLQERIDEAVEAHQKQLEEAREADRERLEDMRVNRARQLADEDEDRALRRERAIQDHNEQLAEMDRQHALTMQRIEEEAAAEREALNDALAKDLAAVGIYIEGYHKKMAERDKLIEEWFDKIILELEKKIYGEQHAPNIYNPDTSGPRLSYSSGGPVRRSGPAILHAGEFVLSRDMLAAGYSPVAGDTNHNSRSVTIQSGAVTIYTTPGMEMMVGELVEDKLVELLGEV